VALNFPSSPSIGDRYPTPPIAGVASYAWDGEKWTSQGNVASGGTVLDAPVDGATYGRKDGAWVKALPLATTATIAAGYTATPYNLGNITSFTLNPALGNYQYGTNNAAATWTAPANDCAIDVLVTNGATAGAITFTGFTVGISTGDTVTLVNGQRFIISIRRINAISTYLVKALQ
jgi:hypothetical protein